MGRIPAVILAAGLAAALGGCSSLEYLIDETVATTEAETGPEETAPVQTLAEDQEVNAFPEAGEGFDAAEEREDLKLILGTDVHYLAKELTDMEEGFTYSVEHGTGLVTNYIWEITDAFIAEVLNERPDALILSGDLSLNGELPSHKELAEKLKTVEENGIPVLVIPGNHDINNVSAARYSGSDRLPAEKTSPEDFLNIYWDFGYGEALSRDARSLSYTYQLDEHTVALMVDTCQYDGTAQVGGMIDTETYDWIELQLADAAERGMNVLPVAHHNLLEESRVYSSDCTIEHSEEFIEILENWDLTTLFLSGHLHVQHFANSSEYGDGIWEIVTSSLATPPCQYGVVFYGDDGSFQYHTQILDMDLWASVNGITDENLLKFSEYRTPFLEKVFYNNAYDMLIRKPGDDVTQEQKQAMAQMYAAANCYYYWGRAVEIADEFRESEIFRLWQEYGYPSLQTEYLEYILEEGVVDYNLLSHEEGPVHKEGE